MPLETRDDPAHGGESGTPALQFGDGVEDESSKTSSPVARLQCDRITALATES